jgi:hypothetical protein
MTANPTARMSAVLMAAEKNVNDDELEILDLFNNGEIGQAHPDSASS